MVLVLYSVGENTWWLRGAKVTLYNKQRTLTPEKENSILQSHQALNVCPFMCVGL